MNAELPPFKNGEDYSKSASTLDHYITPLSLKIQSIRVRRRSWRHTAKAIQVKPVLFLRVLGVIQGVPLFDWTVRNRAMGSIHTTLLVVLDFRKQPFDLKSVSIKRIVCSVDCGECLTDCIQQGARSLYFETGQPAETGHCGDKWNRDSLTDSVIRQSPSWLTLTQSPTRLYLGQFNTISLPATGWVAEVEVLWATLKITNETTSVPDR